VPGGSPRVAVGPGVTGVDVNVGGTGVFVGEIPLLGFGVGTGVLLYGSG
jgi:hypothetical protein